MAKRRALKPRVGKGSQFSWIKVFRLMYKLRKERSGKWVIAINNVADPRRFQEFKDIHRELKEDIALSWIPEGSTIQAFKAVSKSIPQPTRWECFKWAFRRELRIWRINLT